MYDAVTESLQLVEANADLEALRDIFKKYVEIVGRNEGITFLYEHEWTDKEWKIITSLTRV